MIDHQRRLLFIHVARTGGTSIESALIGRDWWDIDPLTKHLSASQTRQHYGDAVWNEYDTFTVVRNPWDRLVSMWTTGWWHPAIDVAPELTFRDFVQSLRPHPHEFYRSLHYRAIFDEPIDSVLPFERLDVEFDALLKRQGFAGVRLPRCGRQLRGPCQQHYDTETRRLVAREFADDIARLNYSL